MASWKTQEVWKLNPCTLGHVHIKEQESLPPGPDKRNIKMGGACLPKVEQMSEQIIPDNSHHSSRLMRTV